MLLCPEDLTFRRLDEDINPIALRTARFYGVVTVLSAIGLNLMQHTLGYFLHSYRTHNYTLLSF